MLVVFALFVPDSRFSRKISRQEDLGAAIHDRIGLEHATFDDMAVVQKAVQHRGNCGIGDCKTDRNRRRNGHGPHFRRPCSGGSQVKTVRKELDERLKKLKLAESLIVEDPETMRGTPVYRGTRIPVDLHAGRSDRRAPSKWGPPRDRQN